MSTNHVSVRLDPDTMARVDALAPNFSTQWRPATRSDILRGLILAALERFEERGSLSLSGQEVLASPAKSRTAKGARKGRAKTKRG